jgi:prephenate dehydrogenase
VTELTAEQHDRLTASVQVATHAAILAFGLTLQRLGYDRKLASSVTTPPHTTMLNLLARIANGAPEVYWDIQSVHPHASEVRAAMLDCLTEISRIVENDDFAGFRLRLGDLLPLVKGPQQ